MTRRQKVKYNQLEEGYEFPPASYQIDSSMAAIYLKAVEDTSPMYQDTELVPPTAVAALTMAALSESLSFPAGTIHVSQEFEFMDTASTKDTLVCHAKVTRKQNRGKLHLLTIDLTVLNQKQKAMLAGKMSFILPEYAEDK